MKNGSVAAKLQMQEQELKIPNQSVEIAIDHSIDKSIKQSTAQSNSHSNELSSAASLFSIFPSATDMNHNHEEEQYIWKLRKKKKGRRIR